VDATCSRLLPEKRLYRLRTLAWNPHNAFMSLVTSVSQQTYIQKKIFNIFINLLQTNLVTV
jgi:hypothetical protein